MAENTSETDGLVLADGSLLAVGRTTPDQALDLFRSEDHGASWSGGVRITGAGDCPAHLLQLASGQILLSYGIRQRGFYRVGVRLSDDGGRSWNPPAVIVELEDSWDGGYPSSVQLPDGSLVTAFYSSGVPTHTRYHTGVVRWQVDEVYARNRPPGSEFEN